MDSYLRAPLARRRRFCEEAQSRLGLPAESIEKDFWVCWTLRELFALPQSGSLLTFKGGTSLSKGWKLIQRFSEDIDVVIDRDALGFGGEQAPQHLGISNKERDRRLEALRSACQNHIRTLLTPELRARFHRGLADSTWTLEHDPDDKDAQTLLFRYPAIFSDSRYLRPVVKIELGARSDTEPVAQPQIQPYLCEALPHVLGDGKFTVRTVAPERTFWEKAMLLHEETYRSGTGPKARLARHYYDLYRLIQAGVGHRAATDRGLFDRVATHRAVFFRKKKEAQESLRPGSLRLVPPPEQLAFWKQDYVAMAEAMFFGAIPDFDEILRVVGEFQQHFNQLPPPA
ncbi:MAG: nucleotidyl transferase AbiEii/AbiGii toxin family protein [Verrucomicrobiota bacterium]